MLAVRPFNAATELDRRPILHGWQAGRRVPVGIANHAQVHGPFEGHAHVRSLADAVLWDEDWRDAEEHLDANPQANRVVKKLLGINKDYYVAVSPDPTEEEMEGIRATLRALTRDTSEPN